MSIMENTIENKRIFFAQYYGQNVFRHRNILLNPSRECNINEQPITSNIENFSDLPNDLGNCFLSLKSTALITHNDVIALTKIIYKEDYLFDYDILHESWETKTIFLVLENPSLLTIECYQYLQSEGYALPFRNLSVKAQEFYGWIELEQ